jgi:thiamine pyrophosphate-dependent acetolactate synthase large subunit-like protein
MPKSIRLPMVCITGQVGDLLGSDAFKKRISEFQPVTKWNYQITEASDS